MSSAQKNLSDSGLIEKPLDSEEWREYDFKDRIYHIISPVKLFYRVDGSTHRVLDAAGIVHCVPAPGNMGCVLRWKSKVVNSPVSF